MSNQVPVVLTNANQSFTDTQKAQGRTNIGAASTSDLISCFKDNLTVTDANSLPETITFSNYQSSAFATALYQGN